MKSALNKKCKALETKVGKLTEELKELKKDYAILLETASEKVEDRLVENLLICTREKS